MAAKDVVHQFVRDALLAGQSRDRIEAALAQAGWSDHEVRDALAEYSEVAFSPPVPRPRPRLTARDVFIYAILFTALTFTATYLVTLVHAILNIGMPDAAEDEWLKSRATDQMRWAIASLIVSTPVYIWMTCYTGRLITKDEGHRRSPVRIWLTYLAVFVAALAFLGDATIVLHGFLQGEATLRFLLKAATVALVSLGIIFFYLRDLEHLKRDP